MIEHSQLAIRNSQLFMLSRFLASSRYLVMIAVIGSFLSATAILVYGGIEVILLIGDAFLSGKIDGKVAKSLLVSFIEIVDLFLLGTVIYIIAIGLYELFIDDQIQLPDWLEIHTLDDLKDKLIGVIVVVLAVLFLGQIVAWDGQRDLLSYGVSIALVIAALTYFLRGKAAKG